MSFRPTAPSNHLSPYGDGLLSPPRRHRKEGLADAALEFLIGYICGRDVQRAVANDEAIYHPLDL